MVWLTSRGMVNIMWYG